MDTPYINTVAPVSRVVKKTGLVEDSVASAAKTAFEHHLFVTIGIEAGTCRAYQSAIGSRAADITVNLTADRTDAGTDSRALGDTFGDLNFFTIALTFVPVPGETVWVHPLHVDYGGRVGRAACDGREDDEQHEEIKFAHGSYPPVIRLCNR